MLFWTFSIHFTEVLKCAGTVVTCKYAILLSYQRNFKCKSVVVFVLQNVDDRPSFKDMFEQLKKLHPRGYDLWIAVSFTGQRDNIELFGRLLAIRLGTNIQQTCAVVHKTMFHPLQGVKRYIIFRENSQIQRCNSPGIWVGDRYMVLSSAPPQ